MNYSILVWAGIRRSVTRAKSSKDIRPVFTAELKGWKTQILTGTHGFGIKGHLPPEKKAASIVCQQSVLC